MDARNGADCHRSEGGASYSVQLKAQHIPYEHPLNIQVITRDGRRQSSAYRERLT